MLEAAREDHTLRHREHQLKRAVDLVIGIPLLLIALPVIVATAIGAAIALRSWPFFTQRRVGRDGTAFTVLKIRTLPVTTPRYCAKSELVPHRIPTFTRWLRRLHLDELPQLFLVVTGAMSLVGPRPEMRMLHDSMPDAAASVRTSVRPGCTGLWQISPASTGLIHEAPQFDEFYVEHQSLRLDLWVLMKTFSVMVLGRRHVDLDAVPAWAVRGDSLTASQLLGAETMSAATADAS